MREAEAWLDRQGRACALTVVVPSAEAGATLSASAAARLGATFGWSTTTPFALACSIARRELAARSLVAASGLAIEAVVATVVHRLGKEGALGRFTPVAHFPGFPRALARTIADVRGAGVTASAIADADLARLVLAYEKALALGKMSDRADVYALAASLVEGGIAHEQVGLPTMFLDVRAHTERERAFASALATRSADVLFVVPKGDAPAEHHATRVAGALEDLPAVGPLGPVQTQLFSSDPTVRADASALELMSAPGESREAIEIARRVKEAALEGTPFDRIAVLLRSPGAYQAHLTEALRRARIPAYFSRGTPSPDPAGRAMLALVSCAIEGLSASRFAEYLSLGELPRAGDEGAPPRPLPHEATAAVPDDESVSPAARRVNEEPTGDATAEASEVEDEAGPVTLGTLRAPRHWEKLIVDAAVIGGIDRWKARLDGLASGYEKQREELEEGDAMRGRIDRDAAALAGLRAFALPLLESLAALPEQASWGVWIDALASIATRALREPAGVLRVLRELSPMGEIGPLGLAQVKLVLEPRLSLSVAAPRGKPSGRVFVGAAEQARGMVFDVVLVPGLAERMFPEKIAQDPILMDAARTSLSGELATNPTRADDERLALRLAVGAARTRAIVSYPRLDVEQARPRTPSFYALDLVRAAEGELPSYAKIAESASTSAGARIGWPAPALASRAIDEAEYDLAILERVLHLPADEGTGAARYLLAANPHLQRALRVRAERWHAKRFYRSDGLVDPAPEAKEALGAHQLAARSFSPTALQHFASCPYRFLLQAVHRLAPREEPVAIEELNPLERGSMMHETLYDTLVALRAAGLLPVTEAAMPRAREILDACAAQVAERFHDDLHPAIDRVWDDTVSAIKADLAEWLRKMQDDAEAPWVPSHFELSFGLKEPRAQQDPKSTKDDVPLDCGIRVRGSIDLVERRADGALRATDFKSGKVRASKDTVIGGGKTLQPVLYALAIEKLLPGAPRYESRLYYCTSVGGYQSMPEAFHLEEAREEAKAVAAAVGASLERGFLPAAPAEGECEWCDYRAVCGPYEQERTSKKPKEPLAKLIELRKHK